MPSLIERASSGRAKCRTCGAAIVRGAERFGEALPNAYGEGESLFWFHLPCAAFSRPESLLQVLDQSQVAAEERSKLQLWAQTGLAHPRLVRLLYAERANSGRARCRHCRELIAQGTWRLALHLFEEGRFNAMGTIHATCAVHYFGTEPSIERLSLPGSELDEAELGEVVSLMREGAKHPASPGLAKTAVERPELESSRKSS
jgi:hypothetical protein